MVLPVLEAASATLRALWKEVREGALPVSALPAAANSTFPLAARLASPAVAPRYSAVAALRLALLAVMSAITPSAYVEEGPPLTTTAPSTPTLYRELET